MNPFFVYLHKKLDTGDVFYVGKGKDRRHLSRGGRSAWWKRIVEKHGLKSEIIERFSDEADAFALERYLIASYRALGIELINVTDGGEGASGRPMSDEHRRRISEAQRGKPNDPAQNAAHSKRMKGRILSEETKRKIGAASRGKTLSDEHRAAISRAQKGRIRTPEQRAAIGLASKAMWAAKRSAT